MESAKTIALATTPHNLHLSMACREISESLSGLVPLRSPIATARLTESLQAIWQKASQFGHPTVTRLCRGLIGSLLISGFDDQHAAFAAVDDSLSVLLRLLESTTNPQLLSEADRCGQLLEGFARESESEWYPSETMKAIISKAIDAHPISATIAESASGHIDQDIYSNDTISGMERCSHEETWIVSQVAAAAEDLAKAPCDVRPAHQLMQILAGHKFFHEIDRVSIVGMMPDANQLVVVDSSLHPRMREMGVRNRMTRGYSCFVNPQGSLAQMKPGVLRIFADSHAVLDSFAKEGRPAQRSIAYVAESGLRSGICLAIGRGDSVQGFLFMNSRLPDFFRNVMHDYGPLLSLFSLLGTVSLDAAGFHYTPTRWQGEEDAMYTSRVFCSEEFATQLQNSLSRVVPVECHVSVVNSDAERFLYSPTSVMNAMADAICQLAMIDTSLPNELQIEVSIRRGQVRFSMRCAPAIWQRTAKEWRAGRLVQLSAQQANRPVKVSLLDEAALIEIPYEPAVWSAENINYSVAF